MHRIQTCSLIAGLLLIGSSSGGKYVGTAAAADQPPEPRAPGPAVPSDFAPAGVIVSAPRKFADGWEKIARLPQEFAGRDRWVRSIIKITVERGWLQAIRQTEQGEREWQIVLAEVLPGDDPPQIEVDAGRDDFRLSYRDGRYMIREHRGHLRCIRQPKDRGLWPSLTLSEPDAGSHVLSHRQIDPSFVPACWWDKRISNSWVVIATGPESGKPDCVVRLAGAHLRNGYDNGFFAVDVGTIHGMNGDRQIMDDGEILVAARLTEGEAVREASERAGREKLVGTPAPILAGEWLNRAGSLTWPDLKGRVVLVDFWLSTERDQIDDLHMPRIRELHAEFAERDLAIVVVFRDRMGSEPDLDKFLRREHIKFPVMIDRGGNAERYFVDRHPMYFLVDREGKVAWTGANPPANEVIERLLDKETNAAGS